MKSAGQAGITGASWTIQADEANRHGAQRARTRLALVHHTPMMNGTMMAAMPSMLASSIEVEYDLELHRNRDRHMMRASRDSASRATISPSRVDGLRLMSGNTFCVITLEHARRALSEELIIAASKAPTKIATATGCRYSIASTGISDSGSARSGMITLAIKPEDRRDHTEYQVTGMPPR